jgi:hypothetical protein
MGKELELAKDAIPYDLGRWIGRREAFAAIAGKCTAAEALSLREIRDSKSYRLLGINWDECCSKVFGSSRRNVERILRPLDEFGPMYYHVAQITHVTPEEYRSIAAHISAEGVRLDDAVIPVIEELSEQVSAAVTELLSREQPAKPKPTVGFAAVLKRCEALAEAISALEGELETKQKYALSAAVIRVRRAALAKGAMVA